MNKIREMIFKVLLRICYALDYYIVDYFKIETNHSYSIKKFVPEDKFFEEQSLYNHVASTIDYKEGTYILALYKDNKLIFQEHFIGITSKSVRNNMESMFQEKIKEYTTQHMYFNLSSCLIDHYYTSIGVFNAPILFKLQDNTYYKGIEVEEKLLS